MKERTIEEVHNKEYGHNKFAWFIGNAIKQGYQITNIKEYNEKFKFLFNGIPMEFCKSPKANAKWQLEQCKTLYANYKKLEELQNK